MDDVRKRIAKRLEDKGLDMRSVSKRMGKNPAYLQQYLDRNIPRFLKERERIALAEILDMPERELGAPPGVRAVNHDFVAIEEIDSKAGAGSGGGIQFMDVSKSEHGMTFSADSIRDLWGLPDYYLRGELRISRVAAKIIEIYGDSMYDPANPGAPGSLFPGDRVVIDTADIRPSPPGQFALWDGIGIVVKMVEVIPKTEPARIRLTSRNPSYRAYEATDEEARIIGRVRIRISAM